jgi:DNA-binding NarL/FixJ family response regulator
MPIRLLIAARHPVRADDFNFTTEDDVEIVFLARRVASLPELIESTEADIVLLDLEIAEERTLSAIAEVTSTNPGYPMLLLTRDPPRYDIVARALAAGASGFVDVDSDHSEIVDAVRAVSAGGDWLPAAETKEILRGVAGDLDTTVAERRSKLVTIAVGLIPIAGALAALLSLLWRKYLGNIGVRPVDLGIDPTTRAVDAIAAVLLLVGVFGPLMYVKNWLLSIEPYVQERPTLLRILRRHRVSRPLISLVLLSITVSLSFVADIVLVVFVGPAVLVSLLALTLGISSELPTPLRITLDKPRQAAITGAVIAFLSVSLLSAEVLLMGPVFDPSGPDGIIAPKFLGFGAQPVRVFTVDGSLPTTELLYLGGNADLYVLVDPCNDDTVFMVSVGSSRMQVIDEVSC